jgi:uncharacterized protein (UPF0335 family)
MSDQLRSIYARWQNLEADKAAISEDLKELFAEAKGNGYDAKALRIAFRLKAAAEGPHATAVAETASLVETYITALGGTIDAPRAHPRIAHEISRDTQGEAPAPPPQSPFGKGADGNTGGSHVGDHNAQDGLDKGSAGEGLKAVPRDPAPARISHQMDEDIPTFLRRTG